MKVDDVKEKASDVKATLEQQRAKRPWLDHLIRAGARFQAQRGDFYAAGITYFTVLALFPLIMVGFSIAGFVLSGNPELLLDAKDKVRDSVPGDMGNTLNDLIQQAVDSRATVGVIGLVGGLYAGLGWMNNLRAALTEQWDQKHEPDGFLKTKIVDLGALVGLAFALVLSLGFSAVSSGTVGRRLLALVNLENAPGVGIALKIVSIALAVFASWAVFVWVIARLPREPVTLKSALKAALLAAIVFEIFKQIATFYLKTVLSSPAGVAFGPILGIMVFSFFTSRIILFATAWAATAEENLALAVVKPPEATIIAPRVEVRGGPTAAGGLALFGAGVVAALGLSGMRRKRG
ncbi:inner membrane protein YhjD [Antrihabitans sp. YC2-6]|uniref:inner membrane protein YhjD n=1 Tax=Antrihabitans sp. YC2-6 TaxID=2799498 RepID=UPI0018F68A8E|nr:inner membrane protein YhjD [Antrihabitans sp. YC2-6]MBJ8347387.1 inner membrane protein YhjD [Antrihabitans sp. YC2-6]